MVRKLLSLLGFIVGIIAGLLLAIKNPLFLAGKPPLSASESTQIFNYLADQEPPIERLIRRLLGLGGGAAAADSAIRHLDASIVRLPAAGAYPPGLAIRVAVTSPQNSLWRARLGTLDYWSILWPGTGNVFAAGYSNYWAVAGDLMLSGEEDLADRYALAALPPTAGSSRIAQGSGRMPTVAADVREELVPGSVGQPAQRVVHLDIKNR